MAEGDAPVALLEFDGVAHRDEGVLALSRDLDHPAVDSLVRAQRLAFQPGPVGHDDGRLRVRLARDMASRQDITVLGDDHAAAGRATDLQTDHRWHHLPGDLLYALLQVARLGYGLRYGRQLGGLI